MHYYKENNNWMNELSLGLNKLTKFDEFKTIDDKQIAIIEANTNHKTTKAETKKRK